MSDIGVYDVRLNKFNRVIAEKESEYNPADTINIGWYLSDSKN